MQLDRKSSSGGPKAGKTTGKSPSSSFKSRSHSTTGRSKTYSGGSSNKNVSKNSSKLHRATQSMYGGFRQNFSLGWLSPSDYLFNPYRSPYSFYNYYFYWWLLFDSTNHQEIKNAGVDMKKIQKPQTETYWIRVKDKKGNDQALLVTKSQYERIQKGDHLKLVNQVLTSNDKVLAK